MLKAEGPEKYKSSVKAVLPGLGKDLAIITGVRAV